MTSTKKQVNLYMLKFYLEILRVSLAKLLYFITVWYAGDGTRIIGSRGAKIEATCFTEEERQVIKELFKSKYDINVHVNKVGFSKTGTQQWTFNINSGDYPKFHDIITEIDLIPKVFPYKLCY